MEIQTAKFTDETQTMILINNAISVPVNEDNRHYKMIQEWLAEGNTIEPNLEASK